MNINAWLSLICCYIPVIPVCDRHMIAYVVHSVGGMCLHGGLLCDAGVQLITCSCSSSISTVGEVGLSPDWMPHQSTMLEFKEPLPKRRRLSELTEIKDKSTGVTITTGSDAPAFIIVDEDSGSESFSRSMSVSGSGGAMESSVSGDYFIQSMSGTSKVDGHPDEDLSVIDNPSVPLLFTKPNAQIYRWVI